MKTYGFSVGAVVIALSMGGLVAMTAMHFSATSTALVAASIGLFMLTAWSANRLLGAQVTLLLMGLALALGWFAEEMGSTRGWFFGRYIYTDVLGFRLGSVPLVIPLMWFALCLIGYVMAHLVLWRQPHSTDKTYWQIGLTSLLAAMLITAFDLGADPYFVYVLKAWIMQKTNGGWFGETLQGFAGWMLISFLIVSIFQILTRGSPAAATKHTKKAALLPIAIYLSAMLFQMLFGHPTETRAIAFFAMGIPGLISLVAWWQWKENDQT
jgi:uncharacterized membrane protein